MRDKNYIKRINNLRGRAMFCLEEQEYLKVEKNIENNNWNELRLYVERLIEDQEETDPTKLKELKIMENEITDIFLDNYDKMTKVNEGRKSIIRSIS